MVILSVTFFTACSGDKSGHSGNKQSPENRPENKYYDGKGFIIQNVQVVISSVQKKVSVQDLPVSLNAADRNGS